MSDAIKTIREALDWLSMPGDAHGNALTAACRAALDSLETELATFAEKLGRALDERDRLRQEMADARRAMFRCVGNNDMGEPLAEIVALVELECDSEHEQAESLRAELTTLRARLATSEERNPSDTEVCEALSALRVLLPPTGIAALEVIEGRLNDYDLLAARLAPADSTPGDEELREAIRQTREYLSDRDGVLRMPQDRLTIAAAEAHLRSQQPETEEQRAAVATLLRWFDAKAAILGAPPADIAAALATLAQTRATEEQRAEHAIDAWLDAHPMGSVRFIRAGAKGDAGPCVELVEVEEGAEAATTEFGDSPFDALAKARDAEGGK